MRNGLHPKELRRVAIENKPPPSSAAPLRGEEVRIKAVDQRGSFARKHVLREIAHVDSDQIAGKYRIGRGDRRPHHCRMGRTQKRATDPSSNLADGGPYQGFTNR